MELGENGGRLMSTAGLDLYVVKASVPSMLARHRLGAHELPIHDRKMSPRPSRLHGQPI